MKKIILIIIDGLGDRPIKELGNKTPLEAAKKPNLDWLAENGICGLVEPFLYNNWQKIPESETCHLALFGYEPKKYFLGRGPYEALGINIKLKKGDIAFRGNFATVDENFKVIDRRAGRISETEPLVKSLSGINIGGLQPPHHPPASGSLVKFLFKKCWGHRAVLVLRGRNLSTKISSNDTKVEGGDTAKKIFPQDKTKEALFTAEILNKFIEKSHQILKNHPLNLKRKQKGFLPANYLLIRGPGQFREIPDFYQKYKLKACCIAGGALYKGVAKSLGMNLIIVKGADGSFNTNIKGKFLAVEKSLKKYDFIFIHLKATDNLAEDGNFKKKKEFIEKIDKNLKSILNLKNTLIVVTADHSTCCDVKKHCSELIPILIFGNGRDLVKEFSEKACRKGKLGKIKQISLMKKILGLARQNFLKKT